MAASYNEREPHFRPENRAKVRAVLERLRSTFGGRLLDVGCGTGFVIDLAAGLFDQIDGVDITSAMLARVDTSRGNIRVHEADASRLPFDSGTFDVVSAYSFIHHLDDQGPVLRELSRVLRHGGALYIDLEPNRYFWENVTAVQSAVDEHASRLVHDEIQSVCHTDDRVAEEFSIPQEIFNLAEYNKALTGGINPDEFVVLARGCGFTDVTVNYQWFAGQGKVLHGISAQAAETVDGYLRSALPLSRGLYKYLQFFAVKA
jgi:ubiquinone/menaquinone biosynthesis C-methylase UbiE